MDKTSPDTRPALLQRHKAWPEPICGEAESANQVLGWPCGSLTRTMGSATPTMSKGWPPKIACSNKQRCRFLIRAMQQPQVQIGMLQRVCPRSISSLALKLYRQWLA